MQGSTLQSFCSQSVPGYWILKHENTYSSSLWAGKKQLRIKFFTTDDTCTSPTFPVRHGLIHFFMKKDGLAGYYKLFCMLWCSNIVIPSVESQASSIGHCYLKSSTVFGSRDLELYSEEDKLYLPAYVPSDSPQHRHIIPAAWTLTHRTWCTQLLKFLHILQTLSHFLNAEICNVLQSSFIIRLLLCLY